MPTESPQWWELAPPAVLEEFQSFVAEHGTLRVVSYDNDNWTVNMRTLDGTPVVFDFFKAEVRGALRDDDAAVAFFASNIVSIELKSGGIMAAEFSQAFKDLADRDDALFKAIMKRFLDNSYKESSESNLWNKIMEKLNVPWASFYLQRVSNPSTSRPPSSLENGD